MFNHSYVYLCLLMIRMYLLYYFVDLSLVRVRFGIRLDTYKFSLKHVIREIFKETITVLMSARRQNKQYHDLMRLWRIIPKPFSISRSRWINKVKDATTRVSNDGDDRDVASALGGLDRHHERIPSEAVMYIYSTYLGVLSCLFLLIPNQTM